mmetsp:Transcript_74625/g.209412  ORF Transcript_74625/g.209412 Transcript_74625/m.209412 type:complete len:262 (+) Transcript_74625:778-1563(+)
MRDASAVAISDAVHQLCVQAPRPSQGETVVIASTEYLQEGRGPCVLHPHHDMPLRVQHAQELHDVLVPQLPHGLHLGRDAEDLVEGAMLPLREELHRLGVAGLGVVGEADGAEAAPAEDAFQPQLANDGPDGHLRGQGGIDRRQKSGDATLAGAVPQLLCPLLSQALLLILQRLAGLGPLLLPDVCLPNVPRGARVHHPTQRHEHRDMCFRGAHTLQNHLVQAEPMQPVLRNQQLLTTLVVDTAGEIWGRPSRRQHRYARR